MNAAEAVDIGIFRTIGRCDLDVRAFLFCRPRLLCMRVSLARTLRVPISLLTMYSISRVLRSSTIPLAGL